VIDRDRVRAAHGDAWESEGNARVGEGGGTARVRGARLMASGLPLPQWNNGDVTTADVDREALFEWYEDRGVPWGLRVPIELSVDIGTPLFEKHCYGLEAEGFRPVEQPEGVVFRPAEPADLERFATAEGAAFGDEDDIVRRWVTPVFCRPGFEHWMAQRGDDVAAIASAVWSNGEAGSAVMITGLDALDPLDIDLAKGVAAAILERAFAHDGSVLAHCHTALDDDLAAFAGLGFSEVPGFRIQVVQGEPGGR
jgi:hypothetical protein